MERRKFIQTCGALCLGGGVAALIHSCGSTNAIAGSIEDSDLVIALSDFEIIRKSKKEFKPYLLVDNEALRRPICVFRFSASHYSAVYMECTHQGAELQVFGDKLQCPAHGAEFNNLGEVTTGPADKSLRTFPVLQTNKQLKISLK